MKTVLNLENVPVQDRLMFLGPDLSLQRYDQFKYPEFFKLWEKQKAFSWNPNRIDLSKDRTDFEKLNELERFIFETNIRWQTMTDSMLSRSIHKISEHITNPELEICVSAWADMEQMHSFSYTHIFKNITKNPTEFFDSILKDKEIVKRASVISSSYNDLLGDEPKDLKEKILQAILFTNITEGVSFYVSFVCSFYFGYKGLMEGSAKIVGEIARDENLHVSITQNIIRNWKEKPEEGFQDLLKGKDEMVYELFKLAVQNEKEWAQYLFSRGSLVGLNPDILGAYIEWLANTRLSTLGYKQIFNNKKNPVVGWSTRYFDSSKVQVAPQESELESYLTGSADTSIKTEDFDEFEF